MWFVSECLIVLYKGVPQYLRRLFPGPCSDTQVGGGSSPLQYILLRGWFCIPRYKRQHPLTRGLNRWIQNQWVLSANRASFLSLFLVPNTSRALKTEILWFLVWTQSHITTQNTTSFASCCETCDFH